MILSKDSLHSRPIRELGDYESEFSEESMSYFIYQQSWKTVSQWLKWIHINCVSTKNVIPEHWRTDNITKANKARQNHEHIFTVCRGPFY